MGTNNIIRYLAFLPVMLLLSGLWGNLPEALGANAYGIDVEFKTVYPGVYDKTEQKVLEEISEILSGSEEELGAKIEAQAMGKKFYVGPEKECYVLTLNSGWTHIKYYTPGSNDLVTAAIRLYPGNPLYTDPVYAASSRYGALIAAPFAVDLPAGFAYPPKLTEAYVWISIHTATPPPQRKGGCDHEITFYKPIYAGDTLSSVVTREEMIDVTPAGGSEYRKFRIIGEGEMYNQNGEKVMSQFRSTVETYGVFKDPSVAVQFEDKVPAHAAVRLVKRDWSKIRPRHVYTDADWEYIKELWSKEYIRGADTLYWEDVKIGDEPAWTCNGPLLGMGRSSEYLTVRDILMNQKPEEAQQKLYKDSYGIYRLKESGTGIPGGQRGAIPDGPPDITSDDPNARIGFQNTTARDYAAKVVINWMGDDGFLHKFAWRIGGMDDGVNIFPEDWDRPSYLFKVPYLKEKGKFMETHGYDGDMAIGRAYVCDKYVKDGRHYVDLVVWLEVIEGTIWSECYAVVELPSRGDEK